MGHGGSSKNVVLSDLFTYVEFPIVQLLSVDITNVDNVDISVFIELQVHFLPYMSVRKFNPIF